MKRVYQACGVILFGYESVPKLRIVVSVFLLVVKGTYSIFR